jgi:hypothetical protein
VAGQFLERKTGFDPVECYVSLQIDGHWRHGDRKTRRSGTGVESTLVLSLSEMFSMDYATDRI